MVEIEGTGFSWNFCQLRMNFANPENPSKKDEFYNSTIFMIICFNETHGRRVPQTLVYTSYLREQVEACRSTD